MIIPDHLVETIKHLIQDWGFEYSLDANRDRVIELAKIIKMNDKWIKEHLE